VCFLHDPRAPRAKIGAAGAAVTGNGLKFFFLELKTGMG
jgi:hypothetical protein